MAPEYWKFLLAYVESGLKRNEAETFSSLGFEQLRRGAKRKVTNLGLRSVGMAELE